MKHIILILLTLASLAIRAEDAPAKKVTDSVKPAEKGVVLKMNDTNFDAEFAKYKGVVIVEFSAAWCGPCKEMEPIIKESAAENKDKATLVSLDADESPIVRKRFQIEGVPYFAVVKDGKIQDTHLGTLTKAELQAWIDSALKPNFKPIYNGN